MPLQGEQRNGGLLGQTAPRPQSSLASPSREAGFPPLRERAGRPSRDPRPGVRCSTGSPSCLGPPRQLFLEKTNVCAPSFRREAENLRFAPVVVEPEQVNLTVEISEPRGEPFVEIRACVKDCLKRLPAPGAF